MDKLFSDLVMSALNKEMRELAVHMSSLITDTFQDAEAEDRLAFIHSLSDKMCLECGRVYTRVGQRCQCWNDE